MSMNNRISNADYDILCNYITDVGYGSASAVPKLLDAWEEAKSVYLFDLFGDKLIHEKEVSITKPEALMRADFLDILRDYRTYFCDIIEVLKKHNYRIVRRKGLNAWNWIGDNYPIPDSILQDVDFCYFLEDYISPFTLSFMNEIYILKDSGKRVEGWKTCAYYYYSDMAGYVEEDIYKKIPQGMKLSRFLNKIILPILKELLIDDTARYADFETSTSTLINALSMLNQNNKMSGTLCVSIHPMDYYTMSDNSYDWCSCMSWSNDGEFKCGTLEMCNSKNMIVAYIKGSEKFEGWNSKRWRQLFSVSEEIILGVKGYPYHSSDLEAEVMEMLHELAKTNMSWSYLLDEPMYTKADFKFEIEGEEHYWNIEFNKMYNDCYSEHPVLIGRHAPTCILIEASGPAYSISSGKFIPEDAPEFMLSCPEELDYVRCEECGCWINTYDSHCIEEYNDLCEDCYYSIKDRLDAEAEEEEETSF